MNEKKEVVKEMLKFVKKQNDNNLQQSQNNDLMVEMCAKWVE